MREEEGSGSFGGRNVKENKESIAPEEKKQEDENKIALEIVQVMETDEGDEERNLSKIGGQGVEENQPHMVHGKDRNARGGVQARRRTSVTRKPLADITTDMGNPKMRGKRKMAGNNLVDSMMEVDEVDEQKPKMMKLGEILHIQLGALEASPRKPPQCK